MSQEEEPANPEAMGEDVSVEEEEEEPQEEPQEDPELVALKEEIASLESALKAKRTEVSKMQDLADDYSQAGYARKVAEMENMRRARSVS